MDGPATDPWGEVVAEAERRAARLRGAVGNAAVASLDTDELVIGGGPTESAACDASDLGGPDALSRAPNRIVVGPTRTAAALLAAPPRRRDSAGSLRAAVDTLLISSTPTAVDTRPQRIALATDMILLRALLAPRATICLTTSESTPTAIADLVHRVLGSPERTVVVGTPGEPGRRTPGGLLRTGRVPRPGRIVAVGAGPGLTAAVLNAHGSGAAWDAICTDPRSVAPMHAALLARGAAPFAIVSARVADAVGRTPAPPPPGALRVAVHRVASATARSVPREEITVSLLDYLPAGGDRRPARDDRGRGLHLIDSWAVDPDSDGATLRTVWHADRGPGRADRATPLPVRARIPVAAHDGPRSVAVRATDRTGAMSVAVVSLPARDT